jgi:hypothetical protein
MVKGSPKKSMAKDHPPLLVQLPATDEPVAGPVRQRSCSGFGLLYLIDRQVKENPVSRRFGQKNSS